MARKLPIKTSPLWLLNLAKEQATMKLIFKLDTTFRSNSQGQGEGSRSHLFFRRTSHLSLSLWSTLGHTEITHDCITGKKIKIKKWLIDLEWIIKGYFHKWVACGLVGISLRKQEEKSGKSLWLKSSLRTTVSFSFLSPSCCRRYQMRFGTVGETSSSSSSPENIHSRIISICMRVGPPATQPLQLYSRLMRLLWKCHQLDVERASYINMHHGREPWDSVTLTQRLRGTNNNVCVHWFHLWRGLFSFFVFFVAILASHGSERRCHDVRTKWWMNFGWCDRRMLQSFWLCRVFTGRQQQGIKVWIHTTATVSWLHIISFHLFVCHLVSHAATLLLRFCHPAQALLSDPACRFKCGRVVSITYAGKMFKLWKVAWNV